MYILPNIHFLCSCSHTAEWLWVKTTLPCRVFYHYIFGFSPSDSPSFKAGCIYFSILFGLCYMFAKGHLYKTVYHFCMGNTNLFRERQCYVTISLFLISSHFAAFSLFLTTGQILPTCFLFLTSI